MRNYIISATILLLSLVILPVVLSSSFDSEIGILVEEASELYFKGLNITEILEKLNRAITLYEEGSVEDANRLLREVKSLIENSRIIANSVYLTNTVIKIVTISILIAIPLVVYFLLPRLYLYLWYKSRKKWVVLR